MADDTNTAEREAVARAIWALMREHEDRCDEELEDLSRYHPVWEYADAARASLAASAGSEPVAWPKDAAAVRAFIGSQFERLQYGKENGVPHENDRYTLTSHDLLSAFRWWTENLASPPDGMAGWRDIATAPKDCLVDILNAGRRYAGCHYDRICGEYRHITACGVLIRLKNATHWMPAPPLPASEAKEL